MMAKLSIVTSNHVLRPLLSPRDVGGAILGDFTTKKAQKKQIRIYADYSEKIHFCLTTRRHRKEEQVFR